MSSQKILPLIIAATLFAGCSQLNDTLSPVGADKCRACHALPPADAVHSAHVDSMHYACDLCHPGVNDSLLSLANGHGRGVVQVHIEKAFDSAGASYYDPAKKTCNLIYCHGNFLPKDSGIVSVADTLKNCSFCHPTPPVDRMHTTHRDTAGYACDLCHAGAADSQLTAAAKINHINGRVDVHIARAFDSTGISYYNPAKKTCNLNYCHGRSLPGGDSGMVKITDTAKGCGFCHATPPVDRMHTTHRDTMHYTCDLCHPGADTAKLTGIAKTNHINGVVDVHIAKTYDSLGVTYFDPVRKTCNLAYCHGAFLPGDSGIVKVTDTATGCGFCHDLAKLRLVAHHVDTLISLPIFNKCFLCHSGYNLATKTVNDSLHINGRVDIAGCDQCHENRTWPGK
ncbi:MAG: hypothetical protein PHC61_13680 [Chitinivibrionales bacterium]|nr:hypothetical protein [Chitinivibrionales bacterium]